MTKRQYFLSHEVWPQLRELLNLPDLRINGGVTIHIDTNGIVKVDLLGVMPTKPEAIDTTAVGDEFRECTVPLAE